MKPMNKILYILRGIPGSGKSTQAHQLTDHVFEADQYFVKEDGKYEFDRSQLAEAHQDCEMRLEEAMWKGTSPLAVANTFLRKREMYPYKTLARIFGYQLKVIICKGNYPNIHGVPEEEVERMRARFQK